MKTVSVSMRAVQAISNVMKDVLTSASDVLLMDTL